MITRFSVLLFIASFLAITPIFAQGCSDAGFCTMGAMKPDQPFNKKVQLRLRAMEVSFYRGTTTTTPIVYVANVDASFSLSNKTSFQVKLPYQTVQSGNFGTTGGLGDISLCITRNLFTSEKYDINISLGGKIPSNDSNKKAESKFDELSLPMYYQTSLGTFDAISGISVITPKWLFATGIQVPLNRNNNQFEWDDWFEVYPDDNYVQTYSQSNQLKRGIDVMLRAERNFRFSQFNFSAGLLPIYRITNDEITLNGVRVKPSGAKGLALSGIVTAGYNLNVRSSMRLLVGHKIVQRDRNPDGLTRELVTTFSYNYRF